MQSIRAGTIKNYREIEESMPIKIHLRSMMRDLTILFLSTLSRIDSSRKCIWFICYHHIFDDERKDFVRQLKYLKNYGDFISLDTAIHIFEKNEKIDSFYFCITFDDGYKNGITNALDILIENKCPAAFFISTDYIGCDTTKYRNDAEKFFLPTTGNPSRIIEFLNWDDCRRLIEAGMVIGSHTCSHAPFGKLNDDQIRSELYRSKQRIEKELKITCKHFACPWGRPGENFRIPNDVLIAKEAGYRSFFTSQRGPNYRATNPFRIRRDHVLAKWGNYQLRYFFSK